MIKWFECWDIGRVVKLRDLESSWSAVHGTQHLVRAHEVIEELVVRAQSSLM